MPVAGVRARGVVEFGAKSGLFFATQCTVNDETGDACRFIIQRIDAHDDHSSRWYRPTANVWQLRRGSIQQEFITHDDNNRLYSYIE